MTCPVTDTRRVRPLVALESPSSFTEATASALAASVTVAATAMTTFRLGRSASSTETASTVAKSTSRLDWEYEKYRPPKITPATTTVGSGRTRRSQSTTTSSVSASTSWRP